jgi:Integrase core domain
MRLDVKYYISECACCQKISQTKIPINAYKYTTSTYRPMECIKIDFIGPYLDKGYVLNFIGTFTRWIELYPVREATAERAANCILQHFGRYGSPTKIRSDKGSHFANAVIEKFLVATSTLHILTLQYSPQENSVVERNNKEINRHLRALTFDKNIIDDYQSSLPFVQRLLNSSYNSRTKISPADLLFGNAIELSGGIFNSTKQQEKTNLTLTQSSSKMLNTQNNFVKIARSILIESDRRHNSNNSYETT